MCSTCSIATLSNSSVATPASSVPACEVMTCRARCHRRGCLILPAQLSLTCSIMHSRVAIQWSPVPSDVGMACQFLSSQG